MSWGQPWHSRPLYIKTLFLARHDSWHAVYLYSPQTRVYPLYAGTLGFLRMTLGISVRLRSPQTKSVRCLLRYLLGYNLWCCCMLLPKTIFVPCTTFSVTVCLHSLQTVVYLLCSGTCILSSTTLGIAIRLRSHQTGVCPPSASACPARPLV